MPKTVRLRVEEETLEKAKSLYSRFYPRHKFDLAILLDELIDTADQVYEIKKSLEERSKMLEKLYLEQPAPEEPLQSAFSTQKIEQIPADKQI